MKYRRNYYKLLHVQPDAPTEIIRSSYLTLMMKLKHHPDMGGDNGNASLINQAYETLVDDEKRAQYDRERLYYDRVDLPRGLTPAGPQLAKRRIEYTGPQGGIRCPRPLPAAFSARPPTAETFECTPRCAASAAGAP